MRLRLTSLVRFAALELLAVAAYCLAPAIAQAQTWGPIPGDFDATAVLAPPPQPLDLSGAVNQYYVAEMTNFGYQIYFKSNGVLYRSQSLQTFWCSTTTLPGCDKVPTDPQTQLDLLAGHWIATARANRATTLRG